MESAAGPRWDNPRRVYIYFCLMYMYSVYTRARSSKSADLNEKRFFSPLLRGARTNNNLTSRTDSRGDGVSAVGGRGVVEVGSVCGEAWFRTAGCGVGGKNVKNSTRFVPPAVTAASCCGRCAEKRKRIIKKHFRRARQSVYVYIIYIYIYIAARYRNV